MFKSIKAFFTAKKEAVKAVAAGFRAGLSARIATTKARLQHASEVVTHATKVVVGTAAVGFVAAGATVCLVSSPVATLFSAIGIYGFCRGMSVLQLLAAAGLVGIVASFGHMTMLVSLFALEMAVVLDIIARVQRVEIVCA